LRWRSPFGHHEVLLSLSSTDFTTGERQRYSPMAALLTPAAIRASAV
jgi:hypothetical protein